MAVRLWVSVTSSDGVGELFTRKAPKLPVGVVWVPGVEFYENDPMRVEKVHVYESGDVDVWLVDQSFEGTSEEMVSDWSSSGWLTMAEDTKRKNMKNRKRFRKS